MRVAIIATLALMGAAPAAGEVKEASDSGFTVNHVKTVAASPDKVWTALIEPGRWWSSAHSWSGDAKNFSLDPRAGGCFCERWSTGEVEHGRVVFAAKGQMLRVRGALGPLQSEAVTGTLTFTLKPEGTGTRISVDYVVGGHARFAMKDVASGVDGVIGEQVAALAKLLGG
jgi:uncharacterized protein YndB with AHSA1/START domain